jgi:hypothetical protein
LRPAGCGCTILPPADESFRDELYEDIMALTNEIQRFRTVWNMEADNTIRLLEALPANQYDFRPDPKGRSLGELAWHLSEIDGYTS